MRSKPPRTKPSALAPGTFTAFLKELLQYPARPAPDEPSAFSPGQIIDRFELVREIGRGGCGIVFEARDRDSGRTVALKAVRTGGRFGVREERLLREAEAAALLSHPNIVALQDVGRCERGPYLVLELLHGRTLGETLADGVVDVKEAVRIAVEVAKALAHAHEHGVVHRDLTP